MWRYERLSLFLRLDGFILVIPLVERLYVLRVGPFSRVRIQECNNEVFLLSRILCLPQCV